MKERNDLSLGARVLGVFDMAVSSQSRAGGKGETNSGRFIVVVLV